MSRQRLRSATRGRALPPVDAVAAADPRLTGLFRQFGVVYEYVFDYETGAVKIGDVAPDGAVSML